jgi:hypothetical protein
LGEKATRLGEFKKGIASGATPAEAGMSAREVTLDFAKAGTQAKAVNQIIAFFNSNIRGWDTMITSFKKHPTRTTLKTLALLTLPSILLYMVNRDDDRWKEIPQWQKDSFWIIFSGDKIYRIPKPFELGMIFGSTPERILEYMETKNPKLMKQLALDMLGAGTPGYLPTGLEPVIENLTNYSFFTATPIVPSSKESMPPALQYTGSTSETAKKLGELANYPPAKIDNIIQGWTGGLGRYATSILDGILKGTGISPRTIDPTPQMADIPVLKAFSVRNPYGSSGQTVEDFYNTLAQYTEGEKYLKEMLKTGNVEKYESYKLAHPELLFFYDWNIDDSYSASARYLRTVSSTLSDLTKQQNDVYASKTMTPEEKRTKIDEIDKLKTDVARKGLDNFASTSSNPDFLKNQLADEANKLGLVDSDSPVLSNGLPDIYTMRDLYTKYGSLTKGMTDVKGYDPLVQDRILAGQALDKLDLLPSTPIKDINTDSTKGYTFKDYYKQWQNRVKITDPKELSDYDRQFPNAKNGNLTRRQYDLLSTYASITDPTGRAKFLEANPELLANPKMAYLKDNPEDNARLSLWGQSTIQSPQAMSKLQSMIKSLDIPDKALIDYNKKLADIYVKYSTQYTTYESFDTPGSPLYISDDTKRGQAQDAYLKANPAFRDQKYFADGIEQGMTEPLAMLYVGYQKSELGKARLIFRHKNPAMEAWFVSEGYQPVGDRWK